MRLPPFDQDAVCRKCGHDQVVTIYAAKGCQYPHVCGVPWNGGEHLDRVCQRCHYQWAEAVLDKGRAALTATPEAAQEAQES